ncbi:hypothetical protein [Azospirillum sp. Marseille-Q6669]
MTEHDNNLRSFLALLPRILERHQGEFALMHGGEIVDYFRDAGTAYQHGLRLYESEGRFSIQKVMKMPADLGYASHVLLDQHL